MVQSINIEKELAELLSESISAPFLFIGSGFSRRYLNLPDWKGLLSQFSQIMPFDSYLGTAGNDYPSAALALAHDFYAEWWKENKDKVEIFQSPKWVHAIETPLKYEISQYLNSIDIKSLIESNSELKELLNPNVVIDGIITTNWDQLLETIFPNLNVYVGQSDLFFKNPQSIGEIFKIHGCSTNYSSLILSKNDYDDFNKKNAYLAAKLLSIFLENPVIFIGYSITDKNITDLLDQIATMMNTQDQLERLAKNLIFVTRSDNDIDSLESVIKTAGEKTLYFTHIRTNDYSQIYKALQYSERKIPVHLLRTLKTQIYNIVKTTEDADRRIAIKDFDEAIDKNSKLEFVVGVGVAKNEYGNSLGLNGIDNWDILRDIIFNDLTFQDIDILKQTLPGLSKSNRTYLPVQKYINADHSYANNPELPSALSSLIKNNLEYYINKISSSVKKQFQNSWTLEEIINMTQINDTECSISKKLDFLALWLTNNTNKESCTLLKEKFLKPQFEILKEHTDVTSTFRRLICILDQIENNKNLK